MTRFERTQSDVAVVQAPRETMAAPGHGRAYPRRGGSRLVTAATLAVLVAGACRPTDPPLVTRKPAQNLRQCLDGAGTDQLHNSGASINVVTPSCFYAVKTRGDTLTFVVVPLVPVSSAGVSAPYPYTQNVPPYSVLRVTDTYNQQTFAADGPRDMTRDPNNSTQFRDDVKIGPTTPGLYYNQAAGHTFELRDSISGEIANLQSQFTPAIGHSIRIGVLEENAPKLTGPTEMPDTVASTWTMEADAPAQAYAYTWTVDGVPDATTTYQLTSPLTAGQHVIHATATRVNGTIDSDQMTVWVQHVNPPCDGFAVSCSAARLGPTPVGVATSHARVGATPTVRARSNSH